MRKILIDELMALVDLVRRLMKRIRDASPTAPRVTMFMVEEELDGIDGEIEPRILTFEIPSNGGAMGFDAELDVIDVSLPETVGDINKTLSYFPEVDWRVLLRRMVDHELAHRNQYEYLSKRGISIEEQYESHYKYLIEFQAQNAVPRPFWREVCLRELQKATAVEMGEMLEMPSVWASRVSVLSKGDIKEIFGLYGVAEAMLKLKDIAEKVRTKEDIIRYAPETKKLLGFP